MRLRAFAGPVVWTSPKHGHVSGSNPKARAILNSSDSVSGRTRAAGMSSTKILDFDAIVFEAVSSNDCMRLFNLRQNPSDFLTARLSRVCRSMLGGAGGPGKGEQCSGDR